MLAYFVSLKRVADQGARAVSDRASLPDFHRDLLDVSVTPNAIQIAIPLIAGFESCRLTAYLDIGGIPTVGFGCTGPDITINTVWTQAQAWTQLVARVQDLAKRVGSLVTVELTDHQFAAILSLAYNIGIGNFASSTMLKDINAGNLADVPHQFWRWNLVAGKVSQGLVNRRNAEVVIWNTPDDPINSVPSTMPTV